MGGLPRTKSCPSGECGEGLWGEGEGFLYSSGSQLDLSWISAGSLPRQRIYAFCQRQRIYAFCQKPMRSQLAFQPAAACSKLYPVYTCTAARQTAHGLARVSLGLANEVPNLAIGVELDQAKLRVALVGCSL